MEDFAHEIPEPYRIFGLTLLPLSIGRYRRLARHKVAFVADGKSSADVSDLLLGVVICSFTCSEFDCLVMTLDFKNEIQRWSRIAIPQPWPDWWMRYCPNFHFLLVLFWELFGLGKRWRARYSPDLMEKFALFKRYIADAQKCPPVRCKQAAERILKTHWVDNLELVLREKLGWTGQEIDEEPLSKALAQYFNWADANDLIISDEDIAIAEANTKKIIEALERFNHQDTKGNSHRDTESTEGEIDSIETARGDARPTGDELHPMDVLAHMAAQKGVV